MSVRLHDEVTKLVTDAGLLNYLFAYEFNSASSASDDDFNFWTVKTTTTLPNGSRTIEFYITINNTLTRGRGDLDQ